MELHQTAKILQSLFASLFIRPNYLNVDYQGLICPMSSPFAIFRKNQKLWMAGAVFIALVSFVIAPAIQSYSGSGAKNSRSGPNPVVASWTGSSVTLGEVDQEWDQVLYANAFLRKLASDVMQKGGTPNVPGFSPDFSSLGITSDRDTRERIVERKLLVAEANRMGIHFDDESVKIFLKRFVDGKIDGDEIKKTLFATTNGRMNLFDFNRLMREELTKNVVLHLAGTGLLFEDRRDSRLLARPPLTTPSKNWQDFLKFNREAKIQAFPVFVNDFESQVKGKPSEKEVQEIYKEGKEVTRSRRVIATQPAFMRPKTVNFDFLSIDAEKIIVEQMALVPEATLLAEYDRRVKEKQFRVPVEQEAVGTPAPGSTSPTAPTDGVPATPDATTPSTAASTSPDSPAQVDPKPIVEPAVLDDKPVVPPALENPKDNASVTRKNSNIRLVSFQEDKPAEPVAVKTDPVVQTEPAVPAVKTEPAASPEAAEKTEPSSVLELSDKPAATAPGLPLFPLTGAPAQGETGVADSTPMRTKSFAEVRDQIAREQAMAIANKIIEDRIGDIVGEMSIYQSEDRAYKDSVAQKSKGIVEPIPLDLAKLGQQYGFERGTTGPVDQESIQGTPIGSSFVFSGQRPFSFVALVEEPIPLYTPFVSRGFTGGDKRYVSWKTEETLPMTPAVDGVRTQIEEVWRKQQAFKLAETRAREIASKVGSSALKDSLGTPEEKAIVLEPANFTWFNPMFARMESRLQLSNIELLQPVDDAFMETVFSSKLNEAVVASDSNKTVCYVVQVVEQKPEINSLFERFASAPLEGVSTVSRLESDRALPFWFQNLQKRLGFRGQ
jgi:hypothetical protein